MSRPSIPFLDLHRVNTPHEAAILAASHRVVQGGHYVLGQEVQAFEREWAQYCGVAHAVGVGSGLDALRLILEAYRLLGRLQSGAEILVPANTYFATHLAIVQAGMVPVLVDADPIFGHLAVADLAPKLSADTQAMVVVPLHGLPEPMDQLQAFAQKHQLLLIEDAAQAHGASFHQQKMGTWGHAAAFSFYPTKNLGALGDAGAIATLDAGLADKLRQLRDYGRVDAQRFKYQGINSRLDELQAAILRVKLPHLEAENAQRRVLAEHYLAGIHHPAVALPQVIFGGEPVWHHFVVQVSHRDHFRTYLQAQGIGTAVHYEVPPHRQAAWPAQASAPKVPQAEQLFQQNVSLPLFPGLQEAEIQRVIAVVNDYLPPAKG